jgi:glutathione S-transferase
MPVGKIYMNYVSPPARSVLILIDALKLDVEKVEVSGHDDLFKEEFLKINPAHTIPVYVDGDGTIVVDSHAIMIYIVEKYGQNTSYYPKDPAKRAVVHNRLFYDTGVAFQHCRTVSARVRGVIKCDEVIDEALREEIKEVYKLLNSYLEQTSWIAGNEVTIADFSLISTVGAMNVAVPVGDEFNRVKMWMDKAEAWPHHAVNKKGLLMTVEFLKQSQK